MGDTEGVHVRGRPKDPRPKIGRERPAARRAPAGGIETRRARALEEPLDFRRLPGPYPRLEVRNPIHGTHYLVLLPVYPDRGVALCTCTDFARAGLGTCKHVEAAVRWLDLHPEAVRDPGPATDVAGEALWEEVDRRTHSVPSELSPARRMDYAGEALARPKARSRKKEGVGTGDSGSRADPRA